MKTCVKFESSTYSSSLVIGQVKVFVHPGADSTTIALRTFLPESLKSYMYKYSPIMQDVKLGDNICRHKFYHFMVANLVLP